MKSVCATDAVSSSRFTGNSVSDWRHLRGLFPLSTEWIEMGAMVLNSHPAPVADAIARYRLALDHNPVVYLEENNRRLRDKTRMAAADYLGGVEPGNIALTDSTTMGVALVYHGLRLRPDQEVITTTNDYYVTHESLRLAAARSSATVRHFQLYDPERPKDINAAELADRVIREVGDKTRVVALTWVQSDTGLKLPIDEIGKRINQINDARDLPDHVLLCLDGVHGFGNQHFSFAELGCDFLITGCHKWLFGPRGTGIVVGTAKGWSSISPTIPSFVDLDSWNRWVRNDPAPPEATTADSFMPGGFKAYEHVWALAEAFQLHQAIGKKRIAERTSELAGQLKEGLQRIHNVTLHTPGSADLSAGIVSFDIQGRRPWEVVAELRKRKIVGSVAPYATPHVRLTPSIRNDPDEIETVLRAVQGLAR